MLDKDFYGSNYFWFVGVVKDIEDPLNSNRVRVRIKGIHPEDPAGDGTNDTSSATPSSGGGGSTGSGSSSSTGSSSSQTTPLAAIQPLSDLPTATQTSKKVSKHFTLGHFTSSHDFGGAAGYAYLQQHPEIIKNISNLACNALDPLYEQFKFRITSGVRTPGKSDNNTSNHGFGYAADVQMSPGSTAGLHEIYNWVNNNLRGRFTACFLELSKHVHIQLGDKGSLQSPIVKQIN